MCSSRKRRLLCGKAIRSVRCAVYRRVTPFVSKEIRLPPLLLTLPQLARVVDVEYRTLHSWVSRGLLVPSLQVSEGTGKPNLFLVEDAVVAKILADMRELGLSLEQLQEAAARLPEHRDELMEGAFVLVNGKVEVTRDRATAEAALENDGWTLVYRSNHAVEAVRDQLAEVVAGRPAA